MSLFTGRSGQFVLVVEVLVVLLDSPRDVATLTVADNVVIQPPPVDQLPLFVMLRPDVLHHVELPLVFLLTQSALEHGPNVGAEMNLQVPENKGLEGALGALVLNLPRLTFLLFPPTTDSLARPEGVLGEALGFLSLSLTRPGRFGLASFQIVENILEGFFRRFFGYFPGGVCFLIVVILTDEV